MRAAIATIGYIILWLVTFVPAWILLVKLAVAMLSKSKRFAYIAKLFVLYIFVILLPYLYVLLVVGSSSSLLRLIVFAVIVLSLVTAVLQIWGAEKVERSLWKYYASVYDGLLNFYPYRELVGLVSQRALLSIRPESVVADIGAGTGNVSLAVLQQQPNIKLDVVEPIAPMLKRARRKLKGWKHAKFCQQDAVRYLQAQPSSSLDVVVLSNVLYILQDRSAFWSELHRVLKPKGVAVITNSDTPGSNSLIAYHRQHDNSLKLLNPKLMLVGFIDNLISQFAAAGTYSFLPLSTIEKEVSKHGGTVKDVVRCYGGTEQGVNLLFTLHKHKQV